MCLTTQDHLPLQQTKDAYLSCSLNVKIDLNCDKFKARLFHENREYGIFKTGFSEKATIGKQVNKTFNRPSPTIENIVVVNQAYKIQRKSSTLIYEYCVASITVKT